MTERVGSESSLRVLMLCKDFDALGGVVQVVRAMMGHFSRRIAAEHLAIGRPTRGAGALRRLFTPVLDNVRLMMRATSRRFDRIQINASLNFDSLLRDGLFLTLLRTVGFHPVVVFFHGWDDDVARRVTECPPLRWLFVRTFGSSSLLIVLATRFKEAMTAMGVAPERIVVTSTMFDGQLFEGVGRDRESGPVRLLFMSRFVREKGVLDVLEAFAALAPDYPDAELWLVGDGPERDRVAANIERNGLHGRVFLPGYLRGRDKAQALLNADLFVFPTYYGEGCPISLLEAMAAGLPIITRGVGGIPDVFADPENGTLLTSQGARELELSIRRMLDDSAGTAAVGHHNRDEAWENFEAGAVTRKLEDLFLDENRFRTKR